MWKFIKFLFLLTSISTLLPLNNLLTVQADDVGPFSPTPRPTRRMTNSPDTTSIAAAKPSSEIPPEPGLKPQTTPPSRITTSTATTTTTEIASSPTIPTATPRPVTTTTRLTTATDTPLYTTATSVATTTTTLQTTTTTQEPTTKTTPKTTTTSTRVTDTPITSTTILLTTLRSSTTTTVKFPSVVSTSTRSTPSSLTTPRPTPITPTINGTSHTTPDLSTTKRSPTKSQIWTYSKNRRCGAEEDTPGSEPCQGSGLIVGLLIVLALVIGVVVFVVYRYVKTGSFKKIFVFNDDSEPPDRPEKGEDSGYVPVKLSVLSEKT